MDSLIHTHTHMNGIQGSIHQRECTFNYLLSYQSLVYNRICRKNQVPQQIILS